MSSRLAFAPERVNSCFATRRMRSRLRCASARGFLLESSKVLLAIKKSSHLLQPETLSGTLGGYSENTSACSKLETARQYRPTRVSERSRRRNDHADFC